MNRSELISILKNLVEKTENYYKFENRNYKNGDPEDWHQEADQAILKYLNDDEISQLFEKIEKWYS